MSTQNAQQYDVFISFKNTDAYGNQTKDSEIADDLYNFLTNKGLRVFFSNKTLALLGKSQYSGVIDDALESAQILVAVGCSKENLNAEWVKSEWSGFLDDKKRKIKPNAELYVVYQDMSTNDLPYSLRGQQAFNAGDDGAYEKLYKFIMSTGLISADIGRASASSADSVIGSATPPANEPADAEEQPEATDLESRIFSPVYDTPDDESVEFETKNAAADTVSGARVSKPSALHLRQASRRFYKEYYFTNASTILFPFFFGTIALLIFLQQYPFFSIKDNFTAAAGVYVLIIGGIAGLFFLMRSRIAKITAKSAGENVSPFIISKYDAGIILRRKDQQESLVKVLKSAFKERKYVYVVGKSGSGKSLLLDEYQYDNQKSVCRLESRDYAKDTALPDLKKKITDIVKTAERERINPYTIVFDQFESAYEKKHIYKNIIRFIKWLRETKNTSIFLVFVTTKQDYPEIAESMKELLKEGENVYTSKFVTHHIKFTKAERKAIKEQLESQLHLETGETRYNFFVDLLNDLASGNATMIDINIARNYFAKSLPHEYENILKSEHPRDLIMEDYFEKVFATIEEPVLAMVMLQAICKHTDGLTITDFQNLTFAPECEIRNMLDILEKQQIIRKINNIGVSPYTTTHDYLTEYLDIYCSKKLSEQIAINIVFYCEEKSRFKERKTKQELTKVSGRNIASQKSADIPLSQYYVSAVEKKATSKFIVACMILLGTIITAICAWNEMKGYGDGTRYFLGLAFEWNHFTHALTILAAGSAIYYVYHYLQYFAKIFFCKRYSAEWWICGFLIFGGSTLICLAFIYTVLWAAWIALGWSIIGALHLYLSGNSFSNENSKKRLKKEAWLYLVVAFVIISLNVLTLWLKGNMLPYYVVFIVFLLLTIRQHVNTDYMLAKIGVFVNIATNVKDGAK